MKYIILGIKDYCKDTWHDFIRTHAKKQGWNIREVAGIDRPTHRTVFIDVQAWKEGSVWHYIRQRKIAKKHKGQRK